MIFFYLFNFLFQLQIDFFLFLFHPSQKQIKNFKDVGHEVQNTTTESTA